MTRLGAALERAFVAWARRFILRAHAPERHGFDVVCSRCGKDWPCAPLLRAWPDDRETPGRAG